MKKGIKITHALSTHAARTHSAHKRSTHAAHTARFAEFNALAELTGVKAVYNKEDAVKLDSKEDEKEVCKRTQRKHP